MAAPTPGTRVAPTGWMLREGFKTLITLSGDTDIPFWEVSVKPPAVDGGDPLSLTTMHNTAWHTMAPRTLKKLGEVTSTVRYDAGQISVILAQINVNQTVTVTFPENSKVAFYGYLQKFEPSELKEGTEPEASITIVPTNWDPANNVEAAPVWVNSPGTP